MSDLPDDLQTDLGAWFADRPRWLRIAAARMLNGEAFSDETIKEFARMALDEALDDLKTEPPALDLSPLGAATGNAVQLRSISDVKGIGRLNPRRPLSFGSVPITVVYGSNGAGKSSYVRILKHACGARNKGSLHPNVYDGTEVPQSCQIGYREADAEKELAWDPAMGVASELSTIDIFDTHCGDSYLSKEGEPSYEPRLLAFLTDLAGLSDRVSARLDTELQKRSESSLRELPPELAATVTGKWYARIAAETDQAQVDERTKWGDDEEKEAEELTKYFAERSPKERSAELTKQREQTLSLQESLEALEQAYSNGGCGVILDLRERSKEAQKAAELAAKMGLKDAVLDGVGSETWLALWEVARTYSTETAYPDHGFPHVRDGARCVLCQQELGEEGKSRLQSFDTFVKAEASNAAKEAKDKLVSALAKLPEIAEELRLSKATQAGVSEENQTLLGEILREFAARRVQLIEDTVPNEGLGAEPDAEGFIQGLNELAEAQETKAKEFTESFNLEERTRKEQRKSELAAMKWISVQKPGIEAEIKRKKQVGMLEKAKRLCLTTAISRKKGALSEELLTPAYIDSFNQELRCLGARRVKVELAKTRVERGHILHQVKLKDAARSQPIHDILSEGEHRIVCIAAFLADVSAKPNASTFVFDDPISSLDLDFEEAVVQRLVNLSKDRQVVVFTHRLSLLNMVEEYSEKAGFEPEVVHIRAEPWGSGEPGDPSIESAKPKACLNQHVPARIREARAVRQADGEAAYRVHAQQICSEIRKLVERMIETDLLADVLQRHRRQVKTLNKIGKLSDITDDDCRLIDEMMTRYSRYEHSQSAEAPVALPEPEELEEDIAKLKGWRDAIEQRRK
jgi:ABC-type Mn2+/Zn2+ transport system ATPase subunit